MTKKKSPDNEPAGVFRSGFIAICGPPNAGKSTLINRLTGEKISITSDKPQTTRNRILGIVNRDKAQLVFMDTPGIFKASGRLNTRIVDSAIAALAEVDVILMMVDVSSRSRRDDEALVVRHLGKTSKPVVLALNKIDLVKKPAILNHIDQWRAVHSFAHIFPVSAKDGEQTDDLLRELEKLLPPGAPLFPEDMVTDMPERFIAAEMIREKVIRLTGQEIPYATAVSIDTFQEKKNGSVIYIQATIHVEKDSQKGIIIGKQGRMLKTIGERSRLDIQRMTGAKVYLELFVRVQDKWRSDDAKLTEFGLP
ncbi:MAG: GTPase Era [Thermodesulfobacteriota bacterium]